MTKRTILALASMTGLSAGFFVPAWAHGPFDWIMNDPNPEISSCCGPADCHHVEGVEATGAGWHLPATLETIPFDKAKLSKDGKFVRCHFAGDKNKTRCLFVPPGGS